MRNSTYIKTIVSALLLAVFTLGITPKQFLHDVFAKHIDQKSRPDNGKPYQLNASGYNCNCDNLVAESAFESAAYVYENYLPSVFISYSIQDFSFSSVNEIYSQFRGPPVKVS